ncbi:MAG: hypothetical protein RR954_09790 [Christensenellaceae bacterium]
MRVEEEYADSLIREAIGDVIVPIGYCVVCKEEVYAGEEYYEIDSELVHDECLDEYAHQYFEQCLQRER